MSGSGGRCPKIRRVQGAARGPPPGQPRSPFSQGRGLPNFLASVWSILAFYLGCHPFLGRMRNPHGKLPQRSTFEPNRSYGWRTFFGTAAQMGQGRFGHKTVNRKITPERHKQKPIYFSQLLHVGPGSTFGVAQLPFFSCVLHVWMGALGTTLGDIRRPFLSRSST